VIPAALNSRPLRFGCSGGIEGCSDGEDVFGTVFTVPSLPNFENSGRHLDHGVLMGLAMDAAALRRPDNDECKVKAGEGARAGTTAAAGKITYEKSFGVGVELVCFANETGQRSRIEDAKGVVLCSAEWSWGR